VYYTYILQLSNKSYYHGLSDDLKQRFEDYQRGAVASTKDLRPVRLVFYAAFISKKQAIAFEKYLKTGSGLAFRNKHFI
jgi:putative endonuclease